MGDVYTATKLPQLTWVSWLRLTGLRLYNCGAGLYKCGVHVGIWAAAQALGPSSLVGSPELRLQPERLHGNFTAPQPESCKPESADPGQPRAFHCYVDIPKKAAPQYCWLVPIDFKRKCYNSTIQEHLLNHNGTYYHDLIRKIKLTASKLLVRT